ncbi:MAG TPA: MBL fold metallo-hydrolase [Casimicrobiaceae bacterium]|jgi:phosphoribosyl 1,2-cyclic phosphodiesterase|nr:MBL fold metallo-hydrolase [Casimicrobiaceae bacterium]
MKCVRFWGTRGSLPVALTAAGVRRKIVAALRAAAGRRFASDEDLEAYVDSLGMPVSGTYGGHSPCVEIETGRDEYVLCDLGSGVRPFGQKAIARHGPGSPQTYHVFLSHLHWDHIMGFPLFTPAYIPGNRIRIYGGHANLEEALRRQHAAPSFPVDFSALPATLEFVRLDPGHAHDVAGLRVELLLQRHSGDSYGYRFSSGGKTIVYSTDSEHALGDAEDTNRFAAFFRGAEVVIFDAMYSLADAISVKQDWGHSSNIVGVELCQIAGARQLCLFHHEPVHSDEAIERVLAETRRFEQITRGDRPALLVTAAYDGMEIAL